MAKFLYAMEEQEIDQVEELQTSPEEGEVADTQVEVESEAADVADIADAIETGDEAAGELEEVEQVVEQAVEQGKGLDPVAAEALRIAIGAIASKVGANPKAVFSLYASENFASAGSRKNNTQIALEGVQEMLKDLWKKIKAALQKLWSKMKSMWEKHASATGRMVKAVASMKAKVKASSGKITGKAYLDKAPESVARYVKGARDINAKEIKALLLPEGALDALMKPMEELGVRVNNIVKSNVWTDEGRTISAMIEAARVVKKDPVEFRLVGGDTMRVEFDIDSENGNMKVDFIREPGEANQETPGMAVADKGTLLDLLNKAEALIKTVAKHRANSEKTAQRHNETMATIEKLLSKSSDVPLSSTPASVGVDGGAGSARRIMRVVYKTATVNSKIEALIISESIQGCKAVLAYSAACLKQFK